MTRETHSITEQLEALIVQQTDALGTYDRLAQETDERTSQFVIGTLIREAQDDLALIRRVAAGGLGAEHAAFRRDGKCLVSDLRAAGRSARARAQCLRELACSERGLGQEALALLMEALAMNSDKHAHMLVQLAYHVESMPQAQPATRLTRT